MKKIVKKISYITSLVIIFSSIGVSLVLANETLENKTEVLELALEKEDVDTVTEEREEFVDAFKEILNSEKAIDIDDVVENTFEAAPQDILGDLIETEVANWEDEGVIEEEELVVLETNIPVATYEITEDISVTFVDNLVIIDEYEESEEVEVNDLLEENTIALSPLTVIDTLFFTKVEASAKKSKRKSASHTRHIYDTYIKNWKVATAYISAEFTYNGTRVTARRTGNYMRSNGIAGSVIHINKTSSAIQKPSSKRRIAYQAGTAKFGITIKGQGLVFQTRYLRVNVGSNHNGKISKSSELK